MFTLRMKGFRKTKNLRKELESAMQEIQEVVPRADIAVYIHPETRRKKIFSISMIVSGLPKKIVVTSQDTHVYTMIQNAKRVVISQLHRLKEKRVDRRTKERNKEKLEYVPLAENYAN